MVLPSYVVSLVRLYLCFADIVQKLIDKDKHIPAVKYILEFNLADQIPPVPVLEAAVDEAKKLARKLSEEGNSSVSVSPCQCMCPKIKLYIY